MSEREVKLLIKDDNGNLTEFPNPLRKPDQEIPDTPELLEMSKAYAINSIAELMLDIDDIEQAIRITPDHLRGSLEGLRQEIDNKLVEINRFYEALKVLFGEKDFTGQVEIKKIEIKSKR